MVIGLLFFLLINNSDICHAEVHTGTIKGKVLDADTKFPLPGTNVMVVGTNWGAATCSKGEFKISNIPVGNYVLQFSFIGYESLKKTDIIVRPERITFVQTELKMSPLQIGTIEVTPGFFSEKKEEITSIISFSSEEIRRAPGAAGDISRIIMVLPSVAKVNDQTNNLIVRGGSPMENAFYIDNIEIPNINHFPTQASTGGPIGMVNVDFIQDVNFNAGGFSAKYGDRLSSVMEISFREGNQDEIDCQLDLNYAGYGGVAEGPLFNNRGSWLFSARRSYLELVVKTLDVGSTVAPSYGDYQWKVVYNINPKNKLTFIGLWGDDHNNPDREAAEENDMLYYGNQDIYERTTGVNWRILWGKSGYSNTSFTYTGNEFKEDYYQTNMGIHFVENRSNEIAFKFSNINHILLNKKNTIEFGIEAKNLVSKYNSWYAEFTDALGNTTPELILNDDVEANKIGVFVNYIMEPFSRITTTLGLRSDYFSYNENIHISPKLSFSYKFNHLTSLNLSTGIYYQNLPLLFLSQNESNKNLKDLMAIHYVIGLEHLLTENTRLTMEIYQKDYENFPIDPKQPSLFIIDEIYYGYGFYQSHNKLIDNGKAYSRGVEFIVQKKLAKDLYGLVSASYFRARYKDGNGIWIDRVFDNQFIFNFQGGYKPNNMWEFSASWTYAGGAPYTPLDVKASRQYHREVLDENKINQSRYPDYHSLNIRSDRRFYFKHSYLIFYLSIWNAYNHKNVATYFWNDKEQKVGVIYQWLIMPIIGLEYEF